MKKIKRNPAVAEMLLAPHVASDSSFPYYPADPTIPVVIPDPSESFRGLNMWGIQFAQSDASLIVQSNPQRIEYAKFSKGSGIRWAIAKLFEHNLRLSHNEKTVMAVSQHQEGTCRPTADCRKYCYGYGARYISKNMYPIMIQNRDAFRALEKVTDNILSDVAEAIIVLCRQFGCDYIRWNSIGDLTYGQQLIIEKLIQDHNFTVWGYTKKPEKLLELPVQDNLVFHLSIDSSTTEQAIEDSIVAADIHETSLAYASKEGLRYSNQSKKKGIPLKRQPYLEGDAFLRYLLDNNYPIDVAFGFHGPGVVTHLGIDAECPAADPLGGGHFFGACYQCNWCQRKPANREHRTLKEHRVNTIVARYPDGVLISLDTGEEI